MVGEIRDAETARIATQAALTGHLVLSTLHTNDAPAPSRGCSTSASSRTSSAPPSRGVLAQRLVRKLCQNCKEAYEPTHQRAAADREVSPRDVEKLFRAKGCPAAATSASPAESASTSCFVPDDSVIDRISQARTLNEIREPPAHGGMKPLRVDGIEKVKAGITTLEEVYRVTA